VHGSNGDALAGSWVAVSSMPPLPVTDAEFLPGDGTLATLANPPLAALKASAVQSGSSGTPGPAAC
jgi:hypothetical protein